MAFSRASCALSVAGLVLSACAPKPADTAGDSTTAGTSGGSTSGSTAEPTPTGTNTTGTTTSATSEGTTGTSDATGTGASTGTTGEPASVCDPQPEAVVARYTIDDDFEWDDIDLVHHCTVAGVAQDAQLTVSLDGCKQDPADPNEQPVTRSLVLDVAPTDPIDLVVGEEVALHEFVRLIFWTNRFFTLRRPSSELVLAGVNADGVPGGSNAPPAEFLAPFALAVLEGCDFEPIGGPPETNFVDGEPCEQLRRELLRVQFAGGEMVDAIDHSAHVWPDQPYRLVVETAEHHKDLGNCSDVTPNWFRVLVLRTAGG